MLTENDAALVFGTIMSSPGMSEPVRIDLKISRKNVLLLHHVIERGLLENNSGPSVLLKRTAEKHRRIKTTFRRLPGKSRTCRTQ
jgi:hypothetical protein